MNTTETQESGRPAPASCPTLRVLYSGGAVRRAPARALLPGEVAIGRDVPPGTGIQIPDDRRASRHHATFRLGRDGALRVLDEGSKNGTFLGARRVTEAALADGDLVRVGDTFVLVRHEPALQVDGPAPLLLGSSPAIRRLRHALHRAAPSLATVLLLGESGTGKELAARTLHEGSRPDAPLVAVNCGAIPEALAESQLFGHVAGAFTGATAHLGVFRAAHGGTLFLDEIGELPLGLQPKLLRVLEERAVVPLGASRPVPCDVRLVAATNRDLGREAAAGRFRGDLYARLSEVPIGLPPLRERREDVLPLLLAALGAPAELTPALAEALLLYAFPYNVREVWKIAAQLKLGRSGDDPLDLELLGGRLLAPDAARGEAPPDAAPDAPPVEAAEADRRPVPTGAELEALLQKHRGVISQVAREVGRSRRQVDRWLELHGIAPERFRG